MSFSEGNLVPDAGLLPAALLAQRIDLAGLIDERLKLSEHGANSGTKALTVIGSMLAGGDHIDHTAVLRAGATSSLFDLTRAPSTVGTWLRAHTWSNVRQLDAVSRELLARLWQAGAGPADLSAPLTIDLDSTIVEGLAHVRRASPSRARVPGGVEFPTECLGLRWSDPARVVPDLAAPRTLRIA